MRLSSQHKTHGLSHGDVFNQAVAVWALTHYGLERFYDVRQRDGSELLALDLVTRLDKDGEPLPEWMVDRDFPGFDYLKRERLDTDSCVVMSRATFFLGTEEWGPIAPIAYLVSQQFPEKGVPDRKVPRLRDPRVYSLSYPLAGETTFPSDVYAAYLAENLGVPVEATHAFEPGEIVFDPAQQLPIIRGTSVMRREDAISLLGNYKMLEKQGRL